jgi:hypothetical protein
LARSSWGRAWKAARKISSWTPTVSFALSLRGRAMRTKNDGSGSVGTNPPSAWALTNALGSSTTSLAGSRLDRSAPEMGVYLTKQRNRPSWLVSLSSSHASRPSGLDPSGRYPPSVTS